NPLLHTWTLGVEEQFYLVFPIVLLLGWRLTAIAQRRLLSRAFALAAIGALSYASYSAATRWAAGFSFARVGSPQRFFCYGSPARAWEFGLGAMLALAAPYLRRLPTLAGTVFGTVGLMGIGFAALAVSGGSAFSPAAASASVCSACFLLAAGCASQN